MFKKALEDRIQLKDHVVSWEEAIECVAQPLIDNNYILPTYKDAMIANINKLGSYMILMPGIAMPHSRPEDGVNKNGLSLLVLKNEVIFPEDQGAWFILCLAAESADSHMDTIEAIADLLGDDELLDNIKNANTIEEIKKLLMGV